MTSKDAVMRTEPSLNSLRPAHTAPVVFAAGAAIGVLGGMIGLGARSSACRC